MERNKTEWGRKLPRPKKWIENQYLSHIRRANKSNVVCKCQQLSDVEVMSFRAILYLYLWQQDNHVSTFYTAVIFSGFCLNAVFSFFTYSHKITSHKFERLAPSVLSKANSKHIFKHPYARFHFRYSALPFVFERLIFFLIRSFFYVSLMLQNCHYFQTLHEAFFVMFGCIKLWLYWIPFEMLSVF